jgi:RNA polymerase sigma-70 factor (ECF subfamily)
MGASLNQLPQAPAHVAQFTTTHWSVVQAAPESACALETLCCTYWYPLYAYIRRRGHNPEEAEDLTQAFFARLLAGKDLSGVDRAKGKFRSFLLAVLNHFLANEWDRATAAKRGGNQVLLSLDDENAEERYRMEPTVEVTPEKLFERSWARTLLAHALTRLRAEYAADGKAQQFEQIKCFLTEETGEGGYASVVAQLRTSTGAVAVAVHRMRRRYRELVRQEIALTVTTHGELEDEIRHLLAALS